MHVYVPLDGRAVLRRLEQAHPEVVVFDPSTVPAQQSNGGAFSEILEARLSIDGASRVVALKRLRERRIGTQRDDDGLFARMTKELSIWNRLHHPNTVLFLGLCVEGSERPAFVMPWMANGSLDEYIKTIPGFTIRPILDGIAEGLAYLHSRDIIHCDLKADNILVDENHQPHIADFGMSCDLKERDAYPVHDLEIGNPRHEPPEYIWQERSGFNGGEVISKAADMYSLGMTIYEISSSKIPFHDLRGLGNIAVAVRDGVRPPFPEETASKRGLTPEIWSFTQECWKAARADRPTITDLLEVLHPRPTMPLTISEPEPFPPKADRVLREEVTLSSGVRSVKSWYDELSQDLLKNVLLPLLTRRPSAEQRDQRDRLASLRLRVVNVTAQVDQWIECCPVLHPAGVKARRSLQGVVEESRSPPSRWFRRPRARRERLSKALGRWDQKLEEILEEFQRDILRELLESSENVRLQLLGRGRAMLPLRQIIAKSLSSERLKVQEVAESILRILHSGRGRSLEGRDSVYLGLEAMLPLDAVPPPHATLDGLKSETKPTWVSRRFEVCEAHWEGQLVAVKWLRNASSLQLADLTEKLLVGTAHWRLLGHRNVLPFYGVHSGSFKQEKAVALVSQWAIRGDVTRVLEESPHMDRRPIVTDVAHGLAYLHRRGIVHGNIKATNILIDIDGSAMLSDWRLPYGLNIDDNQHLEGTCPSEMSEEIRWLAPEVTAKPGCPTEASDVFSFGRTILEIMTGEVPFDGTSTKDQQDLFDRGELLPPKPEQPATIARGLTDELWTLLIDMWDKDPSKRPDMHMVEHRLAEIFGQGSG